MGATPVLQVTSAGAAKPTLAECLAFVQAAYRSIYGADTYLGNDCQDGQFIALLAQALDDVNGEALAVFNSFSPSTAQGTGLDRNLKLNGIRRKRFSYSTVPALVIGVSGITIASGAFTDPSGNRWALPSSVFIPPSGQILVSATCQAPGAVALAAGAVDTSNGKGSIATTTFGWQSVTNIAAASVGQPVESDSALRRRQSISTMIPSLRLIDGLTGALAAIEGVNRLKVYDNSLRHPDKNGIPANTISVVVDGGDAAMIASVIELKKGSGPSTFGTTVEIVPPLDSTTIPQPIAFFYLVDVPVKAFLTVRNLGGYTPSVEGIWKSALATFVNGLDIGEDVEIDQAFTASKNYDGPGSKTFKIVSFFLSRDGETPLPNDVPIKFFEAASLRVSDISVIVLPQGS